MRILGIACLTSLLSGCITLPEIYVIDKPTLLEMEASADWIDFSKAEHASNHTLTPTPYEAAIDKSKNSESFVILDGELKGATK